MRKAKEKLGAMRWRLTRPAAETLAIFRRADTAAAKGLVVLAAPILFLWIVLFHEDDGAATGTHAACGAGPSPDKTPHFHHLQLLRTRCYSTCRAARRKSSEIWAAMTG